MEQPNLIKSLFGEFLAPEDFKPLVSLGECKEEILVPIIDGILFEKTYALITAPKDSYKSWLAAYIAACVALGKPCFGRAVKQGKVVYVYGEGAMKKRLKRICRVLGDETAPNLFPYALRTDLSLQDAQEDLKRHIPPETILVVIDNYEKYWESDVKDEIVNEAIKFLRCLREHLTVLLLQHDKKNTTRRTTKFDRSRGSTKIPNNSDSSISIKKGQNDVAYCEFYCREQEEPPALKFRLIDCPDGGIVCEEVHGIENKGNSSSDCLTETRAVLKGKMKAPLGKTHIYNTVLKGEGIQGLSANHFFKSVFAQLVAEGTLRISDEQKELYEFTDKNF